MPSGVGGPAAPFSLLVTFFVIFLFREAAAAVAETKQLELVAAARAVTAITENFMVVVVVACFWIKSKQIKY